MERRYPNKQQNRPIIQRGRCASLGAPHPVSLLKRLDIPLFGSTGGDGNTDFRVKLNIPPRAVLGWDHDGLLPRI
jgi:hypothetical protein